MQCEHFIYALYPKLGYRLVKTSNLYKVLSRHNVDYLIEHISQMKRFPTTIHIIFDDDKALTGTYITSTHDEYPRDGVWSHTVVIKIMDYIQLTQPTTVFNPYFLKMPETEIRVLQPLTITVK